MVWFGHGNSALRAAERPNVRSHAERGNEKTGAGCKFQERSLPILLWRVTVVL